MKMDLEQRQAALSQERALVSAQCAALLIFHRPPPN